MSVGDTRSAATPYDSELGRSAGDSSSNPAGNGNSHPGRPTTSAAQIRELAPNPHVFDFREIADFVVETEDTATAANALRNAQDEIDRLRAALSEANERADRERFA